MPIKIICELVKALKKETNNTRMEYVDENGKIFALTGVKYLLGQIIRHYSQPWSHYFVSKRAKDLWESMTDEKMGNYWYRMRVDITKDFEGHLNKYKGNARKPWNDKDEIAKTGDWFYFREVFHDEHIVPINDIEQELLDLEEVSEDNVIKILDKIYICRMLKEEDKELNLKYGRSTDIDKVLETTYADVDLIKDYFVNTMEVK